MTGIGEGDVAEPGVADLTRVVAVDGPAGSGKTTVARRTAQALGWRFVDTGATYRAVTLHVLRAGVRLDDADAVTRVADTARVELDVNPSTTGVRLDGEDVSAEIRGPEVTAAVSAVSAVPGVRARLVLLQRRLMGTEGAVVEGRDIATVVAPLARVKVYLDAREDVRARRRAGDVHTGVLTTPGETAVHAGSTAHTATATYDRDRDHPHDEHGHASIGTPEAAGTGPDVSRVQADLRRRDALDNQTNRLQVSEGAIHIDTSDLSLDEVVAAVVDLVRGAGLASEGER
jgi:cytidylate kinase